MSYGQIYNTTNWGELPDNGFGAIYILLLGFLGGGSFITYADLEAFNAAVIADGGEAVDVDGLWAYIQALPDGGETGFLADATEIVTPYGINGSDTYSVKGNYTWFATGDNGAPYNSFVTPLYEPKGYLSNGLKRSSGLASNTSWDNAHVTTTSTTSKGAIKDDGSFLAGANTPQSVFTSTSGNISLINWVQNPREIRFNYHTDSTGTYVLGMSTGQGLWGLQWPELNCATGTFTHDSNFESAVTDLGNGWKNVWVRMNYPRGSMQNLMCDAVGTLYHDTWWVEGNKMDIKDLDYVMSYDSETVSAYTSTVHRSNAFGNYGIAVEGERWIETYDWVFSWPYAPDSVPTHTPLGHQANYSNLGTATAWNYAYAPSSSYVSPNTRKRFSFMLKDGGANEYAFVLQRMGGSYYSSQTYKYARVWYNFTTDAWSTDATEENTMHLDVEDWGNGWKRIVLYTNELVASTLANSLYIYPKTPSGVVEAQVTGSNEEFWVGEYCYEESTFEFGYSPIPTRSQGSIKMKGAESFVINELKGTGSWSWVFDTIGDLQVINGSYFRLEFDKDAYGLIGGTGSTTYSNASGLRVGNKSYVVVTYDGTTLKAYVNGTEVMSIVKAINFTVDNLEIHNKENHGGIYSGIFYFDSVLTSDQIAALTY